jgi:hypothetical protein
MSNHNVVFAPILIAILSTGLLALNPSTVIGNVQAEIYDEQYYFEKYFYEPYLNDQYDGKYDEKKYGYDNTYYPKSYPKPYDDRASYQKDPYTKDKKDSGVSIQKIKCVNSNVNVNGIDITEIPQEPTQWAAANEAGEGPDGTNTQNGNGFGDKINFDRNLVNICVNLNLNNQERVPFLDGLIP